MKYKNMIPLLRREHDLTQKELAELLGITRPYLSEIENGKSIPGGQILSDLCSIFGKTPEFILGKPVHYSVQNIKWMQFLIYLNTLVAQKY